MTDSGLKFDFSYAPGTTFEQMVAFETAGQLWSKYISDDMTVNIHVEMTNALPYNVVGGALPAMTADISYAKFRDFYEADITSSYDDQYFNSLSLKTDWGVEKFDALIDVGLGNNTRQSSSTIDMTRANAKALGLVSQHSSELDGYILMNDLSNSSVDWRYETYIKQGETGGSKLDFYSVAVHEIGHVLGFVSGVDAYEPVRFNNWTELGQFYDYNWWQFDRHKQDVVDAATPLDMFRYSQHSLDINDSFNTIDLSVGANSYFGPGELRYQFATGKDTSVYGDGFQASHWKEHRQAGEISYSGIMDPLIRMGGGRFATDRDMRAMDVIGYDLTSYGKSILSVFDESNHRKQLTEDTSIMEIEAKEHIAKSMNSSPNAAADWVDWWIDNRPEYADRYVNRDREEDVKRMIEQSVVYEGRSIRTDSYSTRDYSYTRNGFWQSAYFSEFSWQEFREDTIDIKAETILLINDEPASSQLATNESTANNHNEIIQHQAEIATVAMDLLTLTDAEDVIETVSTDLETELLTQSSLYVEQLAESDLVMSLG